MKQKNPLKIRKIYKILIIFVFFIAVFLVFRKEKNFVERESDNSDRLKVTANKALKPNVIIIFTDDQGYGDLGCYGSLSVKTPNTDRLAEEGIRFTDFYACNALCTPSRAGLLTGRYPQRTGLDWILRPEPSLKSRAVTSIGRGLGKLGITDVGTNPEIDGIPQDEITLPEALQVAGYRTGMVGKWHLGDFTRSEEFHPLNHGFEWYYGVPYANRMSPLPMYENEEVVIPHIENLGSITSLYTDAAVEFIDEASDKPFFLYLSHTFPHEPLAASEEFLGKSEGGLYGDAIEELDWSVGRVMEALERNGLSEDTLVIFTSDNGPIHSGSAGGLRGAKGQSFEGGFRVPMIAYWPDMIPAATVSDAPTMNIDFFPTICRLAGVSLPEDRIIDGKDITGLLTGEENESPHEKLFFYHNDELEAVRSGDYKYFRYVHTYQYPMPIDKPHTLLGKIGKGNTGSWPLLYNLRIDPGEAYNLIDSRPEVGDRLLDIMEDWESDMEENPRGWLD